MKGNEALAEAAIRAGLKGYFGYPITPQSELLVVSFPVNFRTGAAFLYRQRVNWRLSTWFMVPQEQGRGL